MNIPNVGDTILVRQWRNTPATYFDATVTDVEYEEGFGHIIHYAYPANGSENPLYVDDNGNFCHYAIINNDHFDDGEF